MTEMKDRVGQAPRIYKRGPESIVGKTHNLKTLDQSRIAYTEKTFHAHYKPLSPAKRCKVAYEGNGEWSGLVVVRPAKLRDKRPSIQRVDKQAGVRCISAEAVKARKCGKR